ncbi:MAG: hypothetical protein IPH05_04420 [Flavobacteriales bacterium]|jgi:hypothetical protein|nr:hypothetical protein [Flavobacteriales bacterium]MBK6882180.1 hypothetical protein [Flavobacteriales bacterium]MBK7101603.1 hypothetical protein [Flavobacteriales bacterium]MBK7112309.1 hypothetical protein [Flavobacteriales bacterium]MBK7481685.1 hypothetical protein [Flavobacteriales bacterium]
MNRLRFLSLSAALLTGVGLLTAQTLSYDWLNFPCGDNLNCNTGCSACNLPAGQPANFFGTNVLWYGVAVCPHPLSTANNTVFTENWPIEPTPGIYVGLSTVTLEDVQVDSVIIRHRRSAAGPQRMRVQFTNDALQAPVTLGDVDVTSDYEETVFTDLGCLVAHQGSDYSGFQLRMQAYQGGDGSWQLDAMRIVTSPCSTVQVGIAENFQRNLQESGIYVDVLGRPVQGQPAPGVYIGARKRVQVY